MSVFARSPKPTCRPIQISDLFRNNKRRQTAKDIGARNVRKALCSRCTDQQPVFPLTKRSLSSASGQGFRFLSLQSGAGGATHYKHHTLAPLWLLLSFQRTNQRSLGLDGRHRTRPVVRAGLEYSRR